MQSELVTVVIAWAIVIGWTMSVILATFTGWTLTSCWAFHIIGWFFDEFTMREFDLSIL